MSLVTVDARRLLCPMPVIRVQNAVKGLEAKTRVQAICTDPGVLNDIPAWARLNGHRVLGTRSEEDEYIVIIEVGGR